MRHKKCGGEVLDIMAGFEVRLNTLIRLENEHCGHEDGVLRAVRQRDKLERWLQGKVQVLVDRIVTLEREASDMKDEIRDLEVGK